MKSIFLGAALFVSSLACDATTISTMGNSGSDFRCLGIDSSCGETFGQTFTVSTGETYLSSFSFAPVSVQGGPVNVQFKLYAWSGSNKTGAVLFQSSVDTLTSTTASTTLTYAPDVTLIQGHQYIALLDTSGLGNNANDSSGFTWMADNSYSAGSFFWERDAGDGSWNPAGGDTRFSATLTAAAPNGVPEPSSIALLGLGLIGFAASRRKSKQ